MGDMADDFAAMREHTRQRHAEWKQTNIDILTNSGVDFVMANNGETLLFREPNKPKADFYPSTGRWRVLGVSKTFRGGAESFLRWYDKQAVGSQSPVTK